MLAAVFGIFLDLLLFFIIGFWLAFWLSSSRNRLLTALAIAPTTGFAITSIAATYLILMDYPVKAWSGAYVLVCSAISIVILLYYILNARSEFKEFSKERDLLWVIAGFVVASILVVSPMLLGGVEFTTLRGNGSDTFNYMAMAGYLDREPYSWKYIADADELIEKDESYPLAVELLGSRWTTSAMLAYTSRIANLPIYQFEYSYTLLFFIIAFGPSYLLGRRMKLSRYFAFAVALVICSGFWAQFVLDTRAFSEINSIPLILSMSYFIIQEVDRKRPQLYKAPVLLGILSISLIFSYIEIVPLCMLSAILFLVILLLKRELKINLLAPLGIILVVVVLGSAPLYSMLGKFIYSQLYYASNVSNDWHQYYYPWLYSNPLIGFWGLTPLTVFSSSPALLSLGKIIEFLLMMIGSVLFVIALLSIFWILVCKTTDIPSVFVISFVGATIMEFLFLYIKDQLWAAGKSLAFGYPFFILLVTGIGLRMNWLSIPPFIYRGFRFILTFLMILQIYLALARMDVATTGVEFVDYIVNHGEYRAHDYDLSPINAVLRNERRATIWTIIPNVWLAEYVNLAFGQNHHVIDRLSVTGHYDNLAGYQETKNLPDYIIVDHTSLDYNKNWKKNVIAENSDFVLLKVSQPEFFFLLIMNPNGIEKWDDKTGFWIGGGKTVIYVISTYDAQISFTADFIPGPSIPDQEQRKLEIFDPAGKTRVLVIDKSTLELFFTVGQGENEIILNDLDIPTITILPNGDTRHLLLGVTNINIEIVK